MKTDMKNHYEMLAGTLSNSQRRLFNAISQEPTAHLYAKKYLARYRLTRGGVGRALCLLQNLSLVGLEDGAWRIQPPEMRKWIEAVHEKGPEAAEVLRLVNLQPTRIRDLGKRR